MWLRVNAARIDRDSWGAQLASAGLQAVPSQGLPDALLMTEAVPVARLPGFAEGDVSVQDGAAQQVARLWQVRRCGQVATAPE